MQFFVAAIILPKFMWQDADTAFISAREALAVGDVQFQKKCLGKLDDVANKNGLDG